MGDARLFRIGRIRLFSTSQRESVMNQTDQDALAGVLGGDLADNVVTLPGAKAGLLVDGAVPITEDATFLITKAGACLLSIAAPGAANIGRRIRLISTTAQAHVLTFTGGTLRAGVAGVTTATFVNVIGVYMEIIAISATVWQMVGTFNPAAGTTIVLT
jgi:hypothetical protein